MYACMSIWPMLVQDRLVLHSFGYRPTVSVTQSHDFRSTIQSGRTRWIIAPPNFSRRATGRRPSRSCRLGSHTLSSEWGLTGMDELTQVQPKLLDVGFFDPNALLVLTSSTAASACEQMKLKDYSKLPTTWPQRGVMHHIGEQAR